MLILKTIKLGCEIIKRSRHNIISEILDICKDSASKTRIVYQANLNFRTVNPYIDLLIKNGLIDVSYGNSVLYKTTEKGMDLLDNFKQINNELKDLR